MGARKVMQARVSPKACLVILAEQATGWDLREERLWISRKQTSRSSPSPKRQTLLALEIFVENW